jgi:hypothetical protein
MRNTRWLRYGLASTIAAFAGLGLTLAACGDDDDAGPGNADTGTGSETTTPDGGGTDASEGGKADAGSFAKLTLVNATTDMGPNSVLNARGDAAIRVCFKQGTTDQNIGVAPYPPLPDKAPASAPAGTPPGIFYGTGGTFPSFGLDLEGRIIVPIVMNAKTLLLKGVVNPGNGSPGTTCDELVGATADASAGLVAGEDYWELPAIPAGTFKKEKAYVLALVGCVGDATIVNKDKCGPTPPDGSAPGVGNLAVKIFETTRAPVSPTSLGIQFLHASAQGNALLGPPVNFPIEPGLMADPRDAGSFQAATTGPVAYGTLTPAMAVTKTSDGDFFVLSKTNPNPAEGPLAPFPLPLIQALSGLGAPTAPTIYVNGANYVFIAVGDPAEPTFNATDGGGPGDGGDGTSFNTKSVHYLAFPTDPTIAAYTP